jgi:hypothetical protein
MPAKAAWMDVDLAEELMLTIGTGGTPVESETQIVMDRDTVGTGTVTAMERGIGVPRLTVTEGGVATTDNQNSQPSLF